MKTKSWDGLLRHPEFGVLATTAILAVVFGTINPLFFLPSILFSMLSYSAELGIVTIGVSLLLISGEFDLSVGSNFGLVSTILALLVIDGLNPILAILSCLGLGALIGTTNGLLTQKIRVSSLIVTLGMMFLLRGLTLGIGGGFSITLPVGNYELLYSILNGEILGTGLRTQAIWFASIVVLFSIILTRTKFGNHVFASGGNRDAAVALGVKASRTKIATYTLTGFLASLSGVISMARFQIASPATGSTLELQAIAGAVIGGIALFGGRGSMLGASIGSFLLGMVALALILDGAPPFWYESFVGVVLIVATGINYWVFKVR